MKAKTIAILIASVSLLSFIIPNKSNSYSPPGTVQISGNLHFDETEITNISWKEYMYWMEQNHGKTSDLYLATLPDTTVWKAPLGTYYFSDTRYRTYPVVGITWRQASDFCEWRSERVMEQITAQKTAKPNKTYPVKISYRLPTPQEWIEIAAIGYSDKTQKQITKKHANRALGNF